MTKPGYVMPIGGAEERTPESPVLRRFFDICGGQGCRIAIIPTASQLAETGPAYQQLFTDMGADEPKSLPFATRADAETNEEWIDVLRRAHGIFLTGGNQLRLSTILGGTTAARVLRELRDDEVSEVKVFPLDRIPWDELAFRSTVDALKDFVRHHQGTSRDGSTPA